MLSPSQFVAICFLGMVCLGPVAFYCCWLASVNRRERPVVLHAGWDFVALIAALFGFLLLGGAFLISLAVADAKLFPSGDVERFRSLWEVNWFSWLLLFLGYLAFVSLIVAGVFHKLGRSLAIYNLDEASASGAIEHAFQAAGYTVQRKGNTWSLDSKFLELRAFHGTRHVGVRFLKPKDERTPRIESLLRQQLAATPTVENPAASWFASVATGLVILVVGLVGMIGYFVFFGRR